MPVGYVPFAEEYVSDTEVSDAGTVDFHKPETYELLYDSIIKAIRGNGSSTYIEGEKNEHIEDIVNHAMDDAGLSKHKLWRGVQLDQDKIQRSIHFDQCKTQPTDYWPYIHGAVAEFYHYDERKRLYALWMREDIRETVLISRELPAHLILYGGIPGSITDIMSKKYDHHITDIMWKSYDNPYSVSDTYPDAESNDFEQWW